MAYQKDTHLSQAVHRSPSSSEKACESVELTPQTTISLSKCQIGHVGLSAKTRNGGRHDSITGLDSHSCVHDSAARGKLVWSLLSFFLGSGGGRVGSRTPAASEVAQTRPAGLLHQALLHIACIALLSPTTWGAGGWCELAPTQLCVFEVLYARRGRRGFWPIRRRGRVCTCGYCASSPPPSRCQSGRNVNVGSERLGLEAGVPGWRLEHP